MTFTKSISFMAKNKSSNHLVIFVLRILIRIFGSLTALHWLNILDKLFHYTVNNLYDVLSTSFYLLFFIYLDWYVKVSSNSNFKNNSLKWLDILKWIPLGFVLLLISLSFQSSVFAWPQKTADTIIYSYTKVWSFVFMPNLAFIIITILIFYTSAVLNSNKKLKEENDLTI